MPKVPKTSKKKLSNTSKSKGGINPRRRKNKRQDEKKSESTECDVRQGESVQEVLVVPEVKKVTKKSKKVIEPEGLRTFDPRLLRDGDVFTFESPGKGKKSYVCTVMGYEILFERNDKHTYTRLKSEIETIVNTCKLNCTLVQK